jgi:hypothetical protein
MVLTLVAVAAFSAPQQSAPPKKATTQQAPAKQPSKAAQPAAESAPAEPRAPRPPQPPARLEFSAELLPRAVGDRWTYQVLSADEGMDMKSLNVTLKEKDEKNVVFAVQFGEGEPTSVTLSVKDATWFTPEEKKEAGFGLRALGDDYPRTSERGITKIETQRFFDYDVAGNFLGTHVYAIEMCVMACGTFPCARIERSDLRGLILSEIWIAPALPAALQSKLQRAGDGKGKIAFELISFKAAGQSQPAKLPAIPAAERQKAIAWVKANNKFGESSGIVADFIFLLHEGIRLFSGGPLQFQIGSGLTKDGQGYVLAWRAGKFSSRAMTAAEASQAGPNAFTRRALH